MGSGSPKMAADMDIANYCPAAEMPDLVLSLSLIGLMVAVFIVGVIVESVRFAEDSK